MNPCEALPRSVEYDGHFYPIHPEWPNVLLAVRALDDESLSEAEQLYTACALLLGDKVPASAGLLKAVFDTLNPEKPAKIEQPVMDYYQDWDLIYAGFWQTYGIDLAERRDLHWMQFVALVKGLPQGTRFADVVGIRQMDIPAPDKFNAKYRQQIIEMKAKYALKGPSGSLQSGLESLFFALKSQAERR